MAQAQCILVADIGGTHCRMALACVDGKRVRLQALKQCATTALGGDAATSLASYHREQGAPPLLAVSVCAAGPLVEAGNDARIKLTNGDLTISRTGVAAMTGSSRTLLVNDFSAVAASVPLLQPADLQWHTSACTPLSELTPVCAVLGAGTGLGVSAWLGGESILAGEGGHVALAPVDARERGMLAHMSGSGGFVSAEDFLSGPGFARAYAALRAIDGLPAAAADAAEVHRRAHCDDALAIETTARFTAALGRVAGDLALTLGACSVLLAGGIVPGWGVGFDGTVFRRAFEAKGPYRSYLSRIPSATVIHPQPALLGLAVLAGALASG